jgi:DNA-binding transcriptional LysR family regulator
MRKLGLVELEAFSAVARHLSFAKAAGELGASRPALSETIRGLEERLGVRLLQRTTRSVTLTEAGERFLARVAPILDDVGAALDAVQVFRDRPAGTLRLTVAPPVVKLVIEPIMPLFLGNYPDITLELSADSGLVDIVAQRFDAGIRVGQRVDKDMIALPITRRASLVTVGTPAYLARHGTPRRPEDLHQHNCLRIRFPGGAFLPWQYNVGGQRVEVGVKGNLIVNTENVLLRAAMDGVGLAQVLAADAAQAIEGKGLVSVLDSFAMPAAEFSLYYPSRRQTPPVLQAFIDVLRKSRFLAGRPSGQKAAAK